MKTSYRALLTAGLAIVLALPAASLRQLLFGIAPSGGTAFLSSGLGLAGFLSSDWKPHLIPFEQDMRDLAKTAAASWRSASLAAPRAALRSSSLPMAAAVGMPLPGRGWLLMPAPEPSQTH